MTQTTYRRCKKCPGIYPAEQFAVCPSCQIALCEPDYPTSLDQDTSGNNNQATQIIGHKNKVEQHITLEREKSDPITFIHRSIIKPVSIGNIQLKSQWFTFLGLFGFIANLASVGGFWMAFTDKTGMFQQFTLPIWTLLLSMFFLIVGFLLRRAKYMTLFFGKTIERDRHGDLYYTLITGKCGLCKHPVSVKTVGSKNARQTVVICSNNPDQHIWAFDPTVLGDVGDDYRERFTIKI